MTIATGLRRDFMQKKYLQNYIITKNDNNHNNNNNNNNNNFIVDMGSKELTLFALELCENTS